MAAFIVRICGTNPRLHHTPQRCFLVCAAWCCANLHVARSAPHQQATPCLHRTRQRFVEERTVTYNRVRGLLSEFGVVTAESGVVAKRNCSPSSSSKPSKRVLRTAHRHPENNGTSMLNRALLVVLLLV